MNEPAYFEIADAPGLKLFRCDRLRSTLSTGACGKNFLRAQRLRPDEVTGVHLCRRCPIGANHAGVAFVELSKLHGLDICPRCHAYAGRIIGGTRCVSCYNREAELLKGRNGKGTKPTMAPLLPRRLTVVVDGNATEVRSERTRDTAEIALAILRVVPGRVVFTRAGAGQRSRSGSIRSHKVQNPFTKPPFGAAKGRRAA